YAPCSQTSCSPTTAANAAPAPQSAASKRIKQKNEKSSQPPLASAPLRCQSPKAPRQPLPPKPPLRNRHSAGLNAKIDLDVDASSDSLARERNRGAVPAAKDHPFRIARLWRTELRFGHRSIGCDELSRTTAAHRR